MRSEIRLPINKSSSKELFFVCLKKEWGEMYYLENEESIIDDLFGRGDKYINIII